MLIVFIAAPIAILINTIRKTFRKEKLKEYFLIIAIGFDQAGGSILYGQEDWTVSSWTFYLWRKSEGMNQSASVFMSFINTLFMDEHHCENSFYAEAKRLNFKAEWI